MKTKKTSVKYYFIFPLIGLVVFTPIYLRYSANYDARLAQQAADLQAQKQQDLAQQSLMRQKAVDEAVAAQAERKKEREAKAAAQAKREAQREDAEQELQKDNLEVSRLTDRSDQLTAQVKEAKEDLAKIQQDEHDERQQLAFLANQVPQAQDNVKKLTDVLQKISDADARVAAAAAAAAAAKKS